MLYKYGYFCPVTSKQVTNHNYFYGVDGVSGVCESCGHINDSTLTHAIKGRKNVDVTKYYFNRIHKEVITNICLVTLLVILLISLYMRVKL